MILDHCLAIFVNVFVSTVFWNELLVFKVMTFSNGDLNPLEHPLLIGKIRVDEIVSVLYSCCFLMTIYVIVFVFASYLNPSCCSQLCTMLGQMRVSPCWLRICCTAALYFSSSFGNTPGHSAIYIPELLLLYQYWQLWKQDNLWGTEHDYILQI